ncbi:hypothetical protein OPV22_005198 [Ensete ventricosum]|uniref:Uncharacterized protein n=1 Tax=Ensete ventricosum TaxID=4639 RepID=A0AAV8Q0M8_ENSVE|nr:hypothetical protein OPV22_005198 [Ensete ventricosum]
MTAAISMVGEGKEEKRPEGEESGGGRTLVHSQVLRIREEDLRIGDGTGEGLSARDLRIPQGRLWISLGCDVEAGESSGSQLTLQPSGSESPRGGGGRAGSFEEASIDWTVHHGRWRLAPRHLPWIPRTPGNPRIHMC